VTSPASDLLNRLLRRIGIEAHRYTLQTSCEAQLTRLLAEIGVDLVLDVGANTGHYARALRDHGYRGAIVSFEPLSAAHARLEARTRRDRAWRAAPRMALGDSHAEVVVHIAGNSESSSILDMLPAHERAAPGSAYVGSESVPQRRLDEAAAPYLEGARAVLLKMDTQGYEDRVLAGAERIMDRITAIQTELSLVPLYAGQPLFDDMRSRIERLGFALYALFPGYVDESTGRTLHVDGFFVRTRGGATGT
jgi:FkbM family methyltransferase